MKDVSRLEGIWPVMPTPYGEDGEIDHVAVKALVDWYAESGCQGVLVSGSGGEFPYLLPEERVAMARTAVETADGRIPVMCGMGPMGTREAVAQAREAMRAGASFLLVALPTYYPVSVARALDHYRALADATDGSVLYYHFPQCTGFDPGPEGVAKILDLDGIVGAKMSRPNIREMRKVVAMVTTRPFALFSGTVLLLKETLDIGGAGAIGILPAVFPKESAEWLKALKNGDDGGAKGPEKILKRAIGLLAGFGAPAAVQIRGLKIISRLPFPVSIGESSPHSAIKEAIRLRGFPIRSDVRGPLPQLTEETAGKVAALLKRLKII